MNNYYAVKCKCGHVGRNSYILITFPVIAEDGKAAAEIAKTIPRCKHHHKDCIREVIKITYEEFVEINRINNDDPYLQCKCIQEQRSIDLSDRIINDSLSDDLETIKECSKHNVYCGKTKVRNPKKYFRFNNP